MGARLIVIGLDVPHARRAAENYRREGFEVAAYASPRSLDRLRGVTADQVVLCGGPLSSHDTARIREATAPCLATAALRPDPGEVS